MKTKTFYTRNEKMTKLVNNGHPFYARVIYVVGLAGKEGLTVSDIFNELKIRNDINVKFELQDKCLAFSKTPAYKKIMSVLNSSYSNIKNGIPDNRPFYPFLSKNIYDGITQKQYILTPEGVEAFKYRFGFDPYDNITSKTEKMSNPQYTLPSQKETVPVASPEAIKAVQKSILEEEKNNGVIRNYLKNLCSIENLCVVSEKDYEILQTIKRLMQ